MSPDVGSDRARKVFVVHGRNREARAAMFTFLRAIGLGPIEWSEAVRLTGEASPYIGHVLDAAFSAAQAIVVLLTPDDETIPLAQARPNVLFEAGMAMGRDPKRTVLVELGQLRPFSDVVGRHAVRMNGSAERRKELAQRLETAGCAVNLTGEDWLSAGDFTAPPPPGGGLPLGKRVPSSGHPAGVRVDARFHERGNNGRLEIINHGSEPVYDVNIELPEDVQGVRIFSDDLPLPRLPAGKSHMLLCSLTMPRNVGYLDLVITGRTAGGDPVREEAFVSLGG
jgi:Predicted nucleotide-binding protein containing TIR-like domain